MIELLLGTTVGKLACLVGLAYALYALQPYRSFLVALPLLLLILIGAYMVIAAERPRDRLKRRDRL